MKITHYDISGDDQHQLERLLPQARYQHSWVDHAISDDAIDPSTEVVTLFVSSKLTAKHLAAMPNLRLIVCRSTGFNNVDLETATSRHITVANVPSYGEDSVAEYTIGMMLALSRRIPLAATSFQQGHASRAGLQGFDLAGKTLGLIGTGRIGRRVGDIAHSIGMTIVADDPQPNQGWATLRQVQYVARKDLFTESDIVSLHTPYLPATHHIIDRNALALMKKSAVVVNTARGELIDTKALIAALSTGLLAGAALDVFEGEAMLDYHNELAILHHASQHSPVESLQVSTLQKLNNVIVTNHNAYNTLEAIVRINQAVADNIEGFAADQPQNVVR